MAITEYDYYKNTFFLLINNRDIFVSIMSGLPKTPAGRIIIFK
jgi:hypothetical protein